MSDSVGCEIRARGDGPVRVLVGGNSLLMMEGLELAIGATKDLVSVGRASSASEVMAALAVDAPDVVVIDDAMDGGHGIDAAARVNAANPAMGIVVLAPDAAPERVALAVLAGCRGYLTAGSSFAALVAAVRTVALGEVSIPASILRSLGSSFVRSEATVEPLTLTLRQRQIVRYLAGGASTDAMAEYLAISPHTVRCHVREVMRRLGVHTRVGAVAKARTLGLLD